MSGKLYIVSTPIGNLSDLSPRAVCALENCDFIAAEDTRVTLKLLNHFGISKPMISYYEHNLRERGLLILDRITSGETCALVSDAGTPAISDPGEDLVRIASERGIDIIPIPGACAAICALSVSSLPTGRFSFEGFLSTSKKSREEHLSGIKDESRTMIFYEAPHKLMRTLNDLLKILGDRRIAVCRELTKIHEQVLRTTISGAIEHFSASPPRGEFVLIISGTEAKPGGSDAKNSGADPFALAKDLAGAGMSTSDISKIVSKHFGIKKNDVYKALLD